MTQVPFCGLCPASKIFKTLENATYRKHNRLAKHRVVKFFKF